VHGKSAGGRKVNEKVMDKALGGRPPRQDVATRNFHVTSRPTEGYKKEGGENGEAKRTVNCGKDGMGRT